MTQRCLVAVLALLLGNAAAQELPVRPGLEADLYAASQEIPGFGGYFFDTEGDLVVYIVDVRYEDAARGALADVAARRAESRARMWTRPARVLVQQRGYTFEQLRAWRDALGGIFGIPGVTSLDLDEVGNRVSVGVSTTAARPAILAEASRLGVDLAAINVFEEEPATLIEALGDNVRPTKGGLKVTMGGAPHCTLGFNVSYSNVAQGIASESGFFTAGHCTATFGSVDSTVFYQGGSRVGAERWDPPLFTTAQDATCRNFPQVYNCRWSDAVFVSYDAGISSSLGRIAQTTFRSMTSGVNGSLDINPSYPNFFIRSTTSSFPSGTYVDKMGATTGWTSGPIGQTCVDRNQIGANLLLCQDQVIAYAAEGDSGSPAFIWTSQTDVSLAGIVWASSGSSYWFSSVRNIKKDFGSAITFF